MDARSTITLTIGTGLLAAGASFWNDHRANLRPEASVFQDSTPNLPWLSFESVEAGRAVAAAAEKDIPVIAWIAVEQHGPPQLLSEVHGRFPTIVIRLDGTPEERSLIRDLKLWVAPLCVVLRAKESAGSEGVSFELVDGIEPATGALHEKFGLSLQILSYGTERWTPVEALPAKTIELARRLRAMGRLRPGDRVEAAADVQRSREADAQIRYAAAEEAQVRDAWRRYGGAFNPTSPPGGPPADQEGPVEGALELTDHKGLRYRGWSALATRFERCADLAAASSDETYLGVPKERWERRLRDATRKGWIGCPDRFVPAYGALLSQRYGRTPEDLDSLDKAFLGAVVRSMAKVIDDDPTMVPWLITAREVLASLR